MRFVLVGGVWCLLWTAALGQFREIRTIAGSGQVGAGQEQGPALTTRLSNPSGIYREAEGSLIIGSLDQHVIYRLDSSYRRLTRIAGNGQARLSGTGGEYPTNISLNQPHEIQVDAQANIYIADTKNHRVGRIEASTGRWSVIAGNGLRGFSGDSGQANEASLNEPSSLAVDGHELFIADRGNHRIRRVDLRSGQITTVSGTGVEQSPSDGRLAIQESLAGPRSVAIDRDNLWIVQLEGHSVWRIDRRNRRIYHVAGTGNRGFSGDSGDARSATFNGPQAVAVNPGVALYVADTENNAIREIDLRSGRIRTVAGASDGSAGFNGDGDRPSERLLNRPQGVCLLENGDLIIGDSDNHRVRWIRR
jgi:DNA-binding beta-propeller fold protein YncE